MQGCWWAAWLLQQRLVTTTMQQLLPVTRDYYNAVCDQYTVNLIPPWQYWPLSGQIVSWFPLVGAFLQGCQWLTYCLYSHNRSLCYLITSIYLINSQASVSISQASNAGCRALEQLVLESHTNWMITAGFCVKIWYKPCIAPWYTNKTVHGGNNLYDH